MNPIPSNINKPVARATPQRFVPAVGEQMNRDFRGMGSRDCPSCGSSNTSPSKSASADVSSGTMACNLCGHVFHPGM